MVAHRRCGGLVDVVAQSRCGGSLVVRQTSGAEVLGSNPASTAMILMRCRIIVLYCKISEQRGEAKKIYKKESFFYQTKKGVENRDTVPLYELYISMTFLYFSLCLFCLNE